MTYFNRAMIIFYTIPNFFWLVRLTEGGSRPTEGLSRFVYGCCSGETQNPELQGRSRSKWAIAATKAMCSR